MRSVDRRRLLLQGKGRGSVTPPAFAKVDA
jgi:hypothetical protein